MRREWEQAVIIGLVAIAAPLLGCAAVARYVIGWSSASPNSSIPNPAHERDSTRSRQARRGQQLRH
jgi:hypothetical protein